MATEYLSDGVILCRIESMQEILVETEICNQLVRASTSDEYLEISCFACSGFTDYNHYLSSCQDMLLSLIYYNNHPHPLLTEAFALRIASHVTNSFLQQANADHRCSTLSPAIAHRLQITILPTDISPADDVAQVAFDEHCPAAKPASVFFVSELVRAKGEKEKEDGDRYELEWSPADHKCSICIDEIEKRWDSLTLPCSHIFHETCVLIWLEKSHVCPLCRFEMPTDDDY